MRDNVSAQLTSVQRDRACGVLLGIAAGDALATSGSGEWTDHTAMAIPVAELAALQADLRRDAVQDRIVERWDWWAATVEPAGAQHPSVVPTAPAALSFLDDETALANAARAISELIRDDPDAADASVLWCAAVRHAVLTGNPDIRVGLGHLDLDRRAWWAQRFDAAEHSPPSAFSADSGGVAAAVQGALSAIGHTPVPDEMPADEVFRADHLRLALEVAAGVSAEAAPIAGGLLGATYGASAVPAEWRLTLRGWPGLRTRDLIHLADNIIGNEDREALRGHSSTWGKPPLRRHPHDEQVWIGGVGPLAQPAQYVPAGVDAIVSLCPIADGYLRSAVTHLDVRLAGDGENANLDFMLLDTVRAVEQLRGEGRTVLVHSMFGTGRAPAVAALYGARRQGIGIEEALRAVLEVVPEANIGNVFRAALHRLAAAA